MHLHDDQQDLSQTVSQNADLQKSAPPTGDASVGVIRSALANHKTISRVLPLFVNDLPAQVASILALLADGNRADARRIVHQLKGCGGGYGFPDITRLAARAELLFDQDADYAAVLAAVEELTAYVRRVEGYQRSQERVAA